MRSEAILELISNPNEEEFGRFRDKLMSLVRHTLDDFEVIELMRICATELSLRMCTDDCSDEVADYALQQVYKAAIVSTHE